MRVVKLYGQLGKRFGRVHRLAIKTPAEAIRALCANHPEFSKYMIESEKLQMGFKVMNGAHQVGCIDEIKDPATREIKIIPVIIGANAEARILVGAALIAASVAVNFIPGGQAFSPFLMNAGVALVIGGVVQMLSPPPKAPSPPERPENTPSYTFNGPVNTTAQGHPVPVGYGRMIVGGATISSSLSIEQLKAGFKRIQVFAHTGPDQAMGDIYSYVTEDNYSVPPPSNWVSKTLIETGTEWTEGHPYQGQTYFVWRFTYYKWTVVPV